MDSIPDPLLLRKSGSAWICGLELRPLDRNLFNLYFIRLYRVGQTQLGSFCSLITNQSNNTGENGKVPFVVDRCLLYRVGQTQLGSFWSLITNQSNNTRENGEVPFVVDRCLLYRVGQTQLGSFCSLITNQSHNTRENGKVPFVVDRWYKHCFSCVLKWRRDRTISQISLSWYRMLLFVAFRRFNLHLTFETSFWNDEEENKTKEKDTQQVTWTKSKVIIILSSDGDGSFVVEGGSVVAS
jgi:hypothetical protein